MTILSVTLTSQLKGGYYGKNCQRKHYGRSNVRRSERKRYGEFQGVYGKILQTSKKSLTKLFNEQMAGNAESSR